MNLARAAAVVFGLLAGGAALVFAVRAAYGERHDPARCGRGLLPTGARCCAPGQVERSGHCFGKPAECPPGMHVAESGAGCVVDARRVHFTGGAFSLGPEDWQAEGLVEPRRLEVRAFSIDATEVTYERWEHCVVAGACRKLDGAEPGLPVSSVDAKDAERYCRFEDGRLPTSDEWLVAALGPEGRRFPWGSTGLVCRRAAFGLVEGPCAFGGGVELSGSRPDGASPEHALDLAGNVAEWTVDGDGRTLARGGSYLSTSALELKSWAEESPPARAAHVGFRCAYDSTEAP